MTPRAGPDSVTVVAQVRGATVDDGSNQALEGRSEPHDDEGGRRVRLVQRQRRYESYPVCSSPAPECTPPTYMSTITTTYDAGHRAIEIVDSVSGTIARSYDALDRLIEEVTPEGTVGYTYDDVDRLATMTVAGQMAIS